MLKWFTLLRPDRVRELAALLFEPSQPAVPEKTAARIELLRLIEQHVVADDVMPEARLFEIFSQSLELQRENVILDDPTVVCLELMYLGGARFIESLHLTRSVCGCPPCCVSSFWVGQIAAPKLQGTVRWGAASKIVDPQTTYR